MRLRGRELTSENSSLVIRSQKQLKAQRLSQENVVQIRTRESSISPNLGTPTWGDRSEAVRRNTQDSFYENISIPGATGFISNLLPYGDGRKSSCDSTAEFVKHPSQIDSFSDHPPSDTSNVPYANAMQLEDEPLRSSTSEPSIDGAIPLLESKDRKRRGVREVEDRSLRGIAVGDNVNQRHHDGIATGSILVCTYRGDHGVADVWEDVRIPRVVSVIRHGNCVMAAGPPTEIRKGFWLIPIVPFGAVEENCFELVEIVAGTKLICTSQEAEVWKGMGSATIKGVICFGTVLKARGSPMVDAGMVLVPIDPRGAIELEHVALFHVYLSGFLPSRDGSEPRASEPLLFLHDRHEAPELHSPGVAINEGSKFPQQNELHTCHQENLDPEVEWIGCGDVLVCLVEEGANVHASCAENDVVGIILFEEHVVARGRAIEVAGMFWIPVRPEGYVRLDFFQLGSRDDLKNVGSLPPSNPGSNRILVGLSRWASGICGSLRSTLEYVLEKCESMKPYVKQSIDADLRNRGRLSVLFSGFPETNMARSFGRELVCSWMMQNDIGFKTMLNPIPNLDITLIRVFLTYFEWAVRLRPDITVDIILQIWLTFSGGNMSRRYTAQQDQSLLLDLLGMRRLGEPADYTTMNNLADLIKDFEEMLREDEDAARKRLVSELISRLEAFYGSVGDGVRTMVGQHGNGLTIDDFSAHLGFLRVFAHDGYEPLARELFQIMDMDGDGLISMNDWVEALEIMRDPENPDSIETAKKQVARTATRRVKADNARDDEERIKAEKRHQDAVLNAFGFGSDESDDDQHQVAKAHPHAKKRVIRAKGKIEQSANLGSKRDVRRRPSLLALVVAEKERKVRMEKDRTNLSADDRNGDHESVAQSAIEADAPSSGDEHSYDSPSALHEMMVDKVIEADVGNELFRAMSVAEKQLSEHRAKRKLSVNGKWMQKDNIMIISGVMARFASGEVCEVHCVGPNKYTCVLNGLALKGKLTEDHRRLVWRHDHISIVWNRDLREGALKKVKLFLCVRIKDPVPSHFWQSFDLKGCGILTRDAVEKIIREDLEISQNDLSDEDVDALLQPLDCNGVSIHDLVNFMKIGIAAITSVDAEKAYSANRQTTEERLKVWRRNHDDRANPKLKRIGLTVATSELLQARLKAATFGTTPEELVKRYDSGSSCRVEIESFLHFIRATLKVPLNKISDHTIVKLYVALGIDDHNELSLDRFSLFVKFGMEYILADTPEELDALKAKAETIASTQKDKLNRAAAATEARRRSRIVLQGLSQTDVSIWLETKQQLRKRNNDADIYSLFRAHLDQRGFPSEWKKNHKTRDEIKTILEEHGVDVKEDPLDRLLTCLDPNGTGEFSIPQFAEFLESPTKNPAKMLASRGLPISACGKVEAARKPFAGKRGVVHFRNQLLDQARVFPTGIEGFLKPYDQTGTGFLDCSRVRALMDTLSNNSALSRSGGSVSPQCSKADARDLVLAIGGSKEGISIRDLVSFVGVPTFLMPQKSIRPSQKKQESKDFRSWRPPAALSDNRWLPRPTPSLAVEASTRMKAARAASPPPPTLKSEPSKQKRYFKVPSRFDSRRDCRSPQHSFSVAGINPVKRRAVSGVSYKGTTDVPGNQHLEETRNHSENATGNAPQRKGNPMARHHAGAGVNT